MPHKNRKTALMSLILSSLVLLSSCGGNKPAATSPTASETPAVTEAPASETTESETSTETSATTKTETTTTKATTPKTSETTEESGEASDGESTDTSDSADAPDTETSDTGDTDTVTEPDITPADTVPAVTAAPETQPTAPPTETTSAPVKHEPSPPVIKAVSSEGRDVFTCDKGTIDYSNAGLGYISAIYTGKKEMAKLKVTCGGRAYDYTIYPDGKYHYFTLSMGSGDYTAQLYERVEGKLYADVTGGSFTAKISNDVDPYTYTNDYIYFDAGSDCVKKASEICGGCDNDIEKVAAVFKYVVENIKYDYELAASIKTWYTPNPDETLRKKTGVCFDYASLMAAMLRSQGVPTRMIFGYVHIAPNDVYHAWNEVYTKETGWVTLEVLFKSAGFNLLDSTLYSTTDDKKWIADLMTDKHSYMTTYMY